MSVSLCFDDVHMPSPEEVGKADYIELKNFTADILRATATTAYYRDKTLAFLGDLEEFDPITAKDSVQTVPLAIHASRVIGSFYGVEVDESSVAMAACLHDIGKSQLPKHLITKSNEGKEWTDRDRTVMKAHPIIGARILEASGYCQRVVRPVEEHHSKQPGTRYGRDPRLSNEERIIRDSISVADFTDAMMNRTNSRNSTLTMDERREECIEEYQMIFDDYNDSCHLAGAMALAMLHMELVELQFQCAS